MEMIIGYSCRRVRYFGEGSLAPLVYKSIPPARIHRALQMTFRISWTSVAGSRDAAAWLGLGLQAVHSTDPANPQAWQATTPAPPHWPHWPRTLTLPSLSGPRNTPAPPHLGQGT
jgi:hypothetical protein